jgi:nucleoside-diphosphate-sugar epimerase
MPERFTVFGGYGFIGSAVSGLLEAEGCGGHDVAAGRYHRTVGPQFLQHVRLGVVGVEHRRRH